ncbi:hypothetical protein [Mesorhizobium sp.]|uniref:hypothetical protein n=1 Tax=Mesorhizobium sp. TaxID=1871066 RepID=UPI0025DCAB5E|nr:hypothetical protein [Mesorhizobium sp.]
MRFQNQFITKSCRYAASQQYGRALVRKTIATGRQTPAGISSHRDTLDLNINSIGHDAASTKLRAGGFTLKYFA